MESPRRPTSSLFQDLVLHKETSNSPSRPSSRLLFLPSHRRIHQQPSCSEESEGDHHSRSRRLIALCGDPKAFLYHKKGCLLDRNPNGLEASEERDEPKTRSVTPVLVKSRGSGGRTNRSRHKPQNTELPEKQPWTRDGLFLRVVNACRNTPSSRNTKNVLARQRAEESASLRYWASAQARFKKIRRHDPDLLVPIYFLEKEAEEDYEAEVLHTALERKANASPVHRLLRSGRRTNAGSAVLE